MIGKRVVFTEAIGHKRCMTIDADYSGTVVEIDGDTATVAVDLVDGMVVNPPVRKKKKVEELTEEEACRA